jgi:hypothetical protein
MPNGKRSPCFLYRAAAAEIPAARQFATLKLKPPTGEQWLHAIKFFRCTSATAPPGSSTTAPPGSSPRKGLNWTKRFSAIAETFAAHPRLIHKVGARKTKAKPKW